MRLSTSFRMKIFLRLSLPRSMVEVIHERSVCADVCARTYQAGSE
jgi:hypothetical protein